MVLAAEGRKANDSHADCYQYFCVPEYGTANGRLHFHAVHFMRTLPTGSVDPNFGRRVRNRRQLFFFSSRRRHTRSLRDWSSDVCSSDLLARIDLDDAELDQLAPQLAVILESIKSISDVAADDVPPTSHAIPLTNVFREDVVVDRKSVV